MNPHRHFRHSLGVQFDIGRRVVDRISTENDEHLNAAAIDVADQFAKLLYLRLIGIRATSDRCKQPSGLHCRAPRSSHERERGPPGDWLSPATTSDLPLWAIRSFAIAAIQAAFSVYVEVAPATPTALAIAFATSAIWLGLTASR